MINLIKNIKDMKKIFKKINDFFKPSNRISDEKIVDILYKLYDHKISSEDYYMLMLNHEIFNFYDKDWIIFNVKTDTKEEDFGNYSWTIPDVVELKLRSIEDDVIYTIEIEMLASKFEKLIEEEILVTLDKRFKNKGEKNAKIIIKI